MELPPDKPLTGVENEERFLRDMRADRASCALFDLLHKTAPTQQVKVRLLEIHGSTKKPQEHTCHYAPTVK